MVIAEDSNRLLLYPMLTRPGRNVQVATSLYTLDHKRQDLIKFNDTQTRQAEQEHISWQSRQMFGSAAALKLGVRANDVPSCRPSTRQDDQSHTSFPALEIHCP